METEGKRSIAEIARQKATEKAPEANQVAEDFQKLINQKRQIEIVQNSLFRSVDPGIKQEAQADTRVARGAVYAEVDKAAADLKAGGIAPEDFKKDIETATGKSADEFQASDFAGDPAVEALHRKVSNMKAIESANQDSEPALRARLEAIGINGEALDAHVKNVFDISMRPNEIAPEVAFKQGVREALQEKRAALAEEMLKAISLRPELNKLVEEAQTVPAVVELGQQITTLNERERPLDDEVARLSSERWDLEREGRIFERAETAFVTAEKYEHLLDAPLTFGAGSTEPGYFMKTDVPLERLERKEQERAKKLTRLQGERTELAGKKTGGLFGMKEADKVAKLKGLDDQIAPLEARGALPSKDTLKNQAEHVGRLFRSEVGGEELAKVVKASGLKSGATLREFIQGMRATIAAQEATRGPERAAALEEVKSKSQEAGGQAGAIRDERAPLKKAKEALESLNHQYRG